MRRKEESGKGPDHPLQAPSPSTDYADFRPILLAEGCGEMSAERRLWMGCSKLYSEGIPPFPSIVGSSLSL
jgi:hypothetical protein